MTEAFLQYVWQHKLFDNGLHTVGGTQICVERVGELNRDAGPDFIGARIKMGDVLWVGNVEIHVHASDWNLHHHSRDKKYNNVILHVVYQYDMDVVLENGKVVPTVEIAAAIPSSVEAMYDDLMNRGKHDDIPCAGYLDKVPDAFVTMAKDRMVVERLERKALDVRQIYENTNGGYEETCYRLVARYFGAKANAFPFEMLAEKTPMSVIAKIRDDSFRVEALLFGQAGLLGGKHEDDYPTKMSKEYSYLRHAYALEPMPGHLWKFFRLRPFSFPTLRISQFANLLCKTNGLFSKLLEAKDIDTLSALFKVEASDYWRDHYVFDTVSKKHNKATGDSFVLTLLVNAWIPLLFEYGTQHADYELRERAVKLLEQMPAEDNRVIRKWRNLGLKVDNAADGQALLQLYNELCSKKKCLDCQLAYRILKT